MLHIYYFTYLSIYLASWLPTSLSIGLPIHLAICLPICLSAMDAVNVVLFAHGVACFWIIKEVRQAKSDLKDIVGYLSCGILGGSFQGR